MLVILVTVITPEAVSANGIHQNAVEVFNGETVSYNIRVVTNPVVGVTHFSINLEPLPVDRVTHPMKLFGTAQSAIQKDLRFEATGKSVPPQPPYIYSIDFPIPTSGPWIIQLDIQELGVREFVGFEVEIVEPAVVRWWLIILVILAISGVIGIVSKRMDTTKDKT